jgi:hypothetical protein
VVVCHHDRLEPAALVDIVTLNQEEHDVLATLADSRVLPVLRRCITRARQGECEGGRYLEALRLA